MRQIIEEKALLNQHEQQSFNEFATLLDNVVVSKYRGQLQELKVNSVVMDVHIYNCLYITTMCIACFIVCASGCIRRSSILQALFDPINPDKETLATRNLTRKERLDNEFWLLNGLASIMSKANFHELNRETIDKAMSEHQAHEGVLVSVINSYGAESKKC